MKSLFTSTFLILATVSLLASCKKKCKVDEVDVNSGAIRSEYVIYPSSGYMTGNMAGDYVIDATNPYRERFEVSLNQGPREPFNYTNFTILAFPVSASCNASFDRNVTVNNATQTVTYKMTVTQCTDCKETRYTENYVMVPAFPANYTVLYDLTMVDK